MLSIGVTRGGKEPPLCLRVLYVQKHPKKFYLYVQKHPKKFYYLPPCPRGDERSEESRGHGRRPATDRA
jgi:hypothetical protein